ncbi:MAG: helix-turn-helix transcriptional regulator [Clostridia bacterium]|nr:helix-turn-helix transcriptional regulator [Clostridia bacterium]
MYLKRLRDLREDADLKQSDIAKILNITRQQYGLYEIGRRDLPIEFLKVLSQFYNVTSDYILELTNNPK